MRPGFLAAALVVSISCAPEAEDPSAFNEPATESLDGNRARVSTLHTSEMLAAAHGSQCHGNGPCDDGNACTFNDRCVKGECRGTAYTCDDGNACTDNVCDGAGGCRFPPNSAPCDDGNACTYRDTCVSGVCAGIAYRCDDGNVCTDDACDGAGFCRFSFNSAPCDDGNACTSNDTCSAGACHAGTLICCSPGPEANCVNGVDDDCDGLTDEADPDCSCIPGPETACNNGRDDDCDGLIDFADPDCVLLPCTDGCPYGYGCFPDNYCHSHCEDGAPDYDESDSDCGGSDCPRCGPGRRCTTSFDCASARCLQGICQ